MNTQEKATIRKSRESIGAMIARFNPESATVTDLRAVMKMLAPLINGAPAGKSVRSTKCKNQPGYGLHRFDGCNLCLAYRDDFSFALWMDALVLYPQSKPNMANLARKLESKESIAERLTNCACGHSGEQHDRDELDNLLGCTICKEDCDHFHYEVASDGISAAAN